VNLYLISEEVVVTAMAAVVIILLAGIPIGIPSTKSCFPLLLLVMADGILMKNLLVY
jgi:hypothetical protein